MTEKEKAIEIYENMYNCIDSHLSDELQDISAKKCALILCNEVLHTQTGATYNRIDSRDLKWWKEVKRIIHEEM